MHKCRYFLASEDWHSKNEKNRRAEREGEGGGGGGATEGEFEALRSETS